MMNTLAKALSRALRRFPTDRRGSIQVLLALALIPLVGGIGLAVDASRGYLVKARLSEAVDAAALAGARSLHQDTWQEDVDRFFTANFPDGYLSVTLAPLSVVSDPAARTVEVTARATVPTTFMRLMSVNDFTVEAHTIVSGERRGLELALVLDVTGSMAGSKLTALQSAGNNLLDILYGESDTLDDLFIAIVPFAGRVNVGDHDAWFTSTPWYFRGCGDPRGGDAGIDDAPPSDGRWGPFYNSYTDGWPWYNATLGCNDSEILPLTASKETVSAAIDDLEAEGNTRTDVGMAWGWRTISPRWRGLWGDAALPRDYDEPLMDKAVIIMTDGENTPWQSGDSESEDDTNDLLLDTCTLMKDEGITIFAINFQTPPSLDAIYEACASTPANHFASPSAEDLDSAFEVIATQLSNLRIVQ